MSEATAAAAAEKAPRAPSVILKPGLEAVFENDGTAGIERFMNKKGLPACRPALRAMINDRQEGDASRSELLALYTRLFPGFARPDVKGALGTSKEILKIGANSVCHFSANIIGIKPGASVRKTVVDVPGAPGGKGVLITPLDESALATTSLDA